MLPARGEKAIDMALKADMVILNTAVAGKWLDAVLKDKLSHVLPKVLWWIHEMRGHYFKVEYVKHLPFVAGAMIDSHTTSEYWKNRTRERLGYALSNTVSSVATFLLPPLLYNNCKFTCVSNCMLSPDSVVGLKCLTHMLCILEIARSLWKLQKIV